MCLNIQMIKMIIFIRRSCREFPGASCSPSQNCCLQDEDDDHDEKDANHDAGDDDVGDDDDGEDVDGDGVDGDDNHAALPRIAAAHLVHFSNHSFPEPFP